MPRIVCLSDTHNYQDEIAVPDGDILLHAGDATGCGRVEEITAFDDWLGRLPHRFKIFVAGNHDLLFEDRPALAQSLITNAVYLQDSMATIAGLKIYGSPWQPWFYDWAFNLPHGAALREKWDLIPEGLDILITHGPPYGILDLTVNGDNAGCPELLDVVQQRKPRLHLFGHIHEGYGIKEKSGLIFANAANCDERYNPVNPPLVFDI